MDKVTIVWQVEDVKSLHPEFTDEQCRETLARFEKHHEGSMDAMWSDLQYHADVVAES
jgi:hypothetical protein